MSLWRVLVAGLAFLLLFGLSLIEGPNAAAPVLRQVGVKHHGFNDATLNDVVVNEEEHLQDRPRVETAYDQKKTDDLKAALEDFWRERGIAVKVLVALTPVPSAPGYVHLEFNLYRG
jgi:hypothetical protein